MTAFTIGALGMIGVPPTGGFVSKWYILVGALQADNYVAVATIIASTVLNAAYFLPIVFAAWFGRERDPGAAPHGEAPLLVVIALMIPAGLTLAFFLLLSLMKRTLTISLDSDWFWRVALHRVVTFVVENFVIAGVAVESKGLLYWRG